MKKLLLLAGCFALALTSCSKTGDDDDNNNGPPAPKDPKACFEVSKNFIDSGETITFTNCSENATGYQWNFGSGGSVTDKVPPPRTYTQSGDFPVTLIVYNQDASINDDTTITVTVARRALSKIVVNKFKAQTNDADGSAADLKLVYGPSSNTQQYETDVKVDAAGSFEWPINPTIVLNNANKSNWVFRLQRVQNGSVSPVTTFGTSPNLLYPSRAAASPFKIVSNLDYDIDLVFDLVK